jgi:prophage regulatory protein
MRRILRLPEVIETVGKSRSVIYDMMDQGEFPQARRIGPRAVGWFSDEIEEWMEALPPARESRPVPDVPVGP